MKKDYFYLVFLHADYFLKEYNLESSLLPPEKNNLAPLIFLPCLHINDNILSQGPGAFSTYHFTTLHCQRIRYQEYFLLPRMHSSIAQNKNIIKKKNKKTGKGGT